MLPINGYLRDSVSVEWVPSGVELRFSVWSIELPSSVLEDNPNLVRFFQRQLSSSDLVGLPEQAQNLIALLGYQGCLIPKITKSQYELREVKLQNVSFCNEMYGIYYAHPLWKVMRGDSIPRTIITQWISRTHFLSRFAGVTASAASANSSLVKVKAAFLKSSIEEYSHFQDYYALPRTLFPLTNGFTAGVAPLASFVAFDYQMLRIAKKDWLAHTCVALFQERTASFSESANKLYSRVESQLGMPGLLDGWRTHISFDESNSHERDLEVLFDQDLSLSLEQIQESFNEAALTIHLLMDGLDDVLKLGKQGIDPRANAFSLTLERPNMQGIESLSAVSRHQLKSRTSSEVSAELSELIASTPPGCEFLMNASGFLLSQFAKSFVGLALECLANCDTRVEITCIGKVLHAASVFEVQLSGDKRRKNIGGRVIQNHLFRHAKSPKRFASSALLYIRLIQVGFRLLGHPVPLAGFPPLLEALESAVRDLEAQEAIVEKVNDAIGTIELMEYAFQKSKTEWPCFRIAVGQNALID